MVCLISYLIGRSIPSVDCAVQLLGEVPTAVNLLSSCEPGWRIRKVL